MSDDLYRSMFLLDQWFSTFFVQWTPKIPKRSSQTPKPSQLSTCWPPKPYKEVIHGVILHFYSTTRSLNPLYGPFGFHWPLLKTYVLDCDYALQLWSTYTFFYRHLWTNVIISKMQCNMENASIFGICKWLQRAALQGSP